MSDTFDPGPGWREVAPGTPDQYRNDHALVEYAADGKRMHVWVREVPVPPLPTAPYTVIRGTWKGDEGARNLVRIQAPHESMWQTLTTGPVKYWGDDTLLALITSFEVLSEPRAATAKAVLGRVRELGAKYKVTGHRIITGPIDQTAREFGVES